MSPCDARRRRFGAQTGFGFLWVLLWTALMGLGLSVAAQVEATAARRDRERELIAVGRQFRAAIERYHAVRQPGGRNEYPGSLQELLQDGRVPGVQRHLRKVFVDPITGRAEWGLVKVAGRIVGVHSLSPQMPLKQSGFGPQELGFEARARYSEWVFSHPADLAWQPGALPGATQLPDSGQPLPLPLPLRSRPAGPP